MRAQEKKNGEAETNAHASGKWHWLALISRRDLSRSGGRHRCGDNRYDRLVQR